MDEKNEQKLSEIEASDQQAEEGSENAEAFEGQGDEKGSAPESDDASNGEDTATPPEADQFDDNRPIADPESKETDSPTEKSKMIPRMTTRKKIILNNSQMTLKGKPRTYPN